MKGRCPRPLDDGDPDIYSLDSTNKELSISSIPKAMDSNLCYRRTLYKKTLRGVLVLFPLDDGDPDCIKLCKEWILIKPIGYGLTLKQPDRNLIIKNSGIPKGIRTPVTAVKGRCPRPLDDGDPDIHSLDSTNKELIGWNSKAWATTLHVTTSLQEVNLFTFNRITSVKKKYWYPQGDSNPCYRRERAVS